MADNEETAKALNITACILPEDMAQAQAADVVLIGEVRFVSVEMCKRLARKAAIVQAYHEINKCSTMEQIEGLLDDYRESIEEQGGMPPLPAAYEDVNR